MKQGKGENVKRATFHTCCLPARITQKAGVFKKYTKVAWEIFFSHSLIFLFFPQSNKEKKISYEIGL